MAEAARAVNIRREPHDTYAGRPRQRDRRIGTIHISRLRAPTLTQPQRQPSTPHKFARHNALLKFRAADRRLTATMRRYRPPPCFCHTISPG